MKATLGLVVPALTMGGGVPAVARFISDVASRDGRANLKLVSLSMDSRDPQGLRLGSPRSWLSGTRQSQGTWNELPYTHVGAVGAEVEFQRYRPRKILREVLSDCDLIQVVCGSAAWANAVLGMGKPVSVQVATRARVERRWRDTKPKGLTGWWRKAMTEVTDRMDDRAMRGVDAIQVENPWMLDYARQLNQHREVDIRYAPPGVDARRFAPGAEPRLAGRRQILCVGRLDDPRKNVGLLLEAFARLPDALRATSRLLLAGSAGPTPDFWLRAQALGLRDSVKFVASPSQEKLVRMYQRAAVFALPSDEEGLGIVILEAMACGVPVVATRCGGPEGIITDGTDGFLVPRDDAVALAARLQALLDSHTLNEAFGRRARATIEARYAEEVAGEAFLEVWDRLLKRTDRR
jgi:D-inositol-3-phosphate glycosyltransferase